ncbi:hypothetical protein Aph01nite_16550 [Acrocarpospora phusangensis]|uniref:Uncharacterized protein n=1 Tax=Acrocarpospora phusangensis TaxID=1070424 RepID=A0A919UP70_9ACTN|nr:hypothetical protein [Acrocarpospora phusangensis]GIH23345.1 hypothetical protein Aph01nite_16550 [Acrocarpospora phusangensis]
MPRTRLFAAGALALALTMTLTGAANATQDPAPEPPECAGVTVALQLKDGRVYVNGEEVDAVPAIPAIPAHPDAAPAEPAKLTEVPGAPEGLEGPRFTMATEAGVVAYGTGQGDETLPAPPEGAVTYAMSCAVPAVPAVPPAE